ncbi:uncharacterized protein LOC142361384 [Opisthocomus hoazin]|uniref:uncharacterized protein LOC142361384 n=1 Tax=Opisthocomus hoazin TaxID=30419 RepID=UPI003F53B169
MQPPTSSSPSPASPPGHGLDHPPAKNGVSNQRSSSHFPFAHTLLLIQRSNRSHNIQSMLTKVSFTAGPSQQASPVELGGRWTRAQAAQARGATRPYPPPWLVPPDLRQPRTKHHHQRPNEQIQSVQTQLETRRSSIKKKRLISAVTAVGPEPGPAFSSPSSVLAGPKAAVGSALCKPRLNFSTSEQGEGLVNPDFSAWRRELRAPLTRGVAKGRPRDAPVTFLANSPRFTESQNGGSWQGPLWVTQPNPLPK